jgi:hypothetical protein
MRSPVVSPRVCGLASATAWSKKGWLALAEITRSDERMHNVDGYIFTPSQIARFGPSKWYVGEIGLPNGGHDESADSPFRGCALALRRDDGWFGWTYAGVVRGAMRAIRKDQRRRNWERGLL